MTESFDTIVRGSAYPAPTPLAYYQSLRGPSDQEAECLNNISNALLQANCMADSGPWPTQGYWREGCYIESGVYGYLHEAMMEGLAAIFEGNRYVAGRVMERQADIGEYGDVAALVTTVLQELCEENDPDY